MRKSISVFAITVFMLGAMAMLIAGSPGTANAIASYTDWANTDLPKEKSMAESRNVLANAQFTNISHGTFTMSGTRGPYTAFIRSIPEKRMVFICVMGPDGAECGKLASHLKKSGIW